MDDLATETADLVVVGAGAAGLATAIFARRLAPDRRVVCVDGATRVGAKILVSGGSRCNVTNRTVIERDFRGGSRRVVRRVLRAFSAARAAAFFAEIGVALHEEDDGKLFPTTNRSRTVLEALLGEMRRCGAELHPGQRVTEVARDGEGFRLEASGRRYVARALTLATGGRSLPKTGSDGLGYELATRLGHGYVATTPALVPLLLDGDRHAALAGVSHPARLALRTDDGDRVSIEGSLLWTHVGISGPVVLDMSRHWLRARAEGQGAGLRLSLCPRETFESIEAWLLEQTRLRPRALVSTVLAERLPAAVAAAWSGAAELDGLAMAHLARDGRRRLVHALVDTPLDVRDSRGYNFAEVTAGGVPLGEIDPARMASRVCDGLYLVGEILDVDGRLGGFNFQWAWSSAWVAASAWAARDRSRPEGL